MRYEKRVKLTRQQQAGPAGLTRLKALTGTAPSKSWHPSDVSTKEAALFKPSPDPAGPIIRLHRVGDGATVGNPRASYVAGLRPTPAF
jgi:hypothetical protein